MQYIYPYAPNTKLKITCPRCNYQVLRATLAWVAIFADSISIWSALHMDYGGRRGKAQSQNCHIRCVHNCETHSLMKHSFSLTSPPSHAWYIECGSGSSNMKKRSHLSYNSLTSLLHIHMIKAKMTWINFQIRNLLYTFTKITYKQNYDAIKLILNLFTWTVTTHITCYSR